MMTLIKRMKFELLFILSFMFMIKFVLLICNVFGNYSFNELFL